MPTFTCPRCGGHCFASHMREPARAKVDPAAAVWIRTCTAPSLFGKVEIEAYQQRKAAGLPTHGCGFQWPETDDAIYGLRPRLADRIDAATAAMERHATDVRDAAGAIKRMAQTTLKIAEPIVTKVAHSTTVNGRPVRAR